jgi:GT2 family glycosyltransferase
MRISWIMLTYNRADFVAQTMAHNIANSGSHIDELIWVDNGSTDHVRDVMFSYQPDVCVLNKSNLGVSKGTNRGFTVATGDYVLLTGPDMLLPDNWLATFRTYLTGITNTGVACFFHQDPNLTFDETCEVNGLRFHPCSPWSALRIVSRELLIKKIGYLREDFGLYGWEDVEWGKRALRVCKENHLLTYAIAGQRAEHLGTPRKDPGEYRAFKTREVSERWKHELLRQCKTENYPYYNPYA